MLNSSFFTTCKYSAKCKSRVLSKKNLEYPIMFFTLSLSIKSSETSTIEGISNFVNSFWISNNSFLLREITQISLACTPSESFSTMLFTTSSWFDFVLNNNLGATPVFELTNFLSTRLKLIPLISLANWQISSVERKFYSN